MTSKQYKTEAQLQYIVSQEFHNFVCCTSDTHEPILIISAKMLLGK